MATIAVVEDDQPIGNLLQEALEKEGYRVLRAWSGTEALYLLDRERPDLVLLDLMLPGLSGEDGILLPKGSAQSLERHVSLPESVSAPVEEGQRLGTLTLSARGEILREIPLTARSSVPRLTSFGVLARLFRTLCAMSP